MSTHLATLTHTQGDMSATTMHLREAHDLFTALQILKYIERTEQLAREYGMKFAEASPEA